LITHRAKYLKITGYVKSDYLLENPSISKYLPMASENLWSADNQQATRLKLIASCEEIMV